MGRTVKRMPGVLSVSSAYDRVSPANGLEAIIRKLNEFGLSEKEAQLYVHLLKYGPKRAGDLARSLKTYREDVYRRCARLIDVGVVTKIAEDSSRYAPVELDEALDAALKRQESELREMGRESVSCRSSPSNSGFGHPIR